MTDDKKQRVADTISSNCETRTPFKFDPHGAEVGHSVVIGPTGKGMSVMSTALQCELVKAGGTVQVIDKGRSLF
ncbi:hypothetical protein [Cupriavidus sp. WS]|uniref:hypothetical protein n=1 Tax=Cupriavidus sp. WS TaxID=1312922 RepID=UPI000492EACB|nr:hypothetical protein [Cupriavidus sp. WS]